MTEVWAPEQANGYQPTPAPDVRFRDGKGGEMPHEWAAYMLNLWWAARDTKLSFGTAVKAATMHFMVGDDS